MTDGNVPFLDLSAGTLELRTELLEAARRVIDSGRYIGGSELGSFEADFASYVRAPHCVGVGNGLDALVLALQAAGVGVGDEVIVPSHTFIATWLAVTRIGAIPVPVEPDRDTMNIDPGLVERSITPRTRAIVPVHLYGNPADMRPITAVARSHDLPVIADAAQAHGAMYHSTPVGALSTACWSFYPGKNLGAYGDAGAVTALDEGFASRVRRLGNYGSERKYVHDEPESTNSRLDPLQAALLRVRLGVLDAWNARRASIAAVYHSELEALPLRLPVVTAGATSAWHLYVVREARREALRAHLESEGVETLVHYPTAIHRQRCYAALLPSLPPLPLAERLASEVLSLPIGPHMTDAQVGRVVAAVKGFY